MPASCSLGPGGKAALDRLGKFATDLASFEQRQLLAVADRYKTVILPATAAAKGITLGKPLRGIPSGRGKLGVRYTAAGSPAAPEVQLRHFGPWGPINQNSRPHVIMAKAVGTRRYRDLISRPLVSSSGRSFQFPAGKAFALGIGGQAKAYARHPGTRGKHILEAARQRLERDFAEILVSAHRDALRQTLRG